MSQDRLQQAFDEFALKVFGNISEQQYIDLRRTFIGGVVAMFNLAMKGLSDGDEVTAQDLEMMADLQREILEFNAAVKAGTK